MCSFCCANTLPLEDPESVPWTHAQKGCKWRKGLYQADPWAKILPSNHPIFLLITRFFLMLDCLRVLEQDGVSSHIVANCLVTILQERVGRRNAGKDFLEAEFKEMWEEMLAAACELRVEGCITWSLNRLDLAWVWHGNNNYPCITKAVKAAQLRSLVLVVERICQSSLKEGPRLENEGPYDQLPEKRVVLMKYLVRFYEIMSQGDRYFLTAKEGKEFQDCAYKVDLLYSDLTKAAQELRLK